MSYLERYLAGEQEQVWAELLALGADVRREPVLADARAVAAETMRRVRRNCERIVGRLQAAGYKFGAYPDGEERWTEGPLVAPTAESRADVEALAGRVGPLPLSLEAFWSEVGSVDLVGMHPSLPDMSDPLAVDPPEGALEELEDWEADRDEEPDGSSHFERRSRPTTISRTTSAAALPTACSFPTSAPISCCSKNATCCTSSPTCGSRSFAGAAFPGWTAGRRSSSIWSMD
ncbi:hypothetical protein SAMN05216486_11028 [bacterium JGI 053]|nr:hypothetical protein SAMN05216486_11028 [bacterium JGI 053]